jgi:nitroreductase
LRLKDSVPPLPPTAPGFGESLAISPSPETLAFLARRRSASALNLVEPGPDGNELSAILTLAARAPDHGKLAPWRFIVLRGAAKSVFVERLQDIAAERPDPAKALAKLGKLRTPPVTVVVISRPVAGDIPEWEQTLSAGAVCTLMIIAAQAMGFGANWITDWYAYDQRAGALLGLGDGERVAGFVHFGTATEPPLERQRPNREALTTTWTP